MLNLQLMLDKIISITDNDIDTVVKAMEKDGLFDELKRKRKRYLGYLAIGLIISILLLYFWQKLIVWVIIGYFIFMGVIVRKFSKGFKKFFSGKYVKLLSEKINYDSGNLLFPMSLSSFYNKSGILNDYQGVDFEEDSISLNTDSFKLYGEEIQTYKIYTDSKGNTSKVTTNHAYILYIEILKHRFPIKEYVKIVPDTNDNIFVKFSFILLYSLGVFILLFLILLFVGIKNLSMLERILAGIFSFIIGWIIKKFFEKNRVRLENTNFEKIFDVYSGNEIEARRLLTPKLMEKLVELVKISKQTGWAMKFVGNKIYAKFDVGSFLEVGLFNFDIKKQVKKFLYQIKYIVDFVNYLNIEYFSEVEFLKEKVINNRDVLK